MIGVIIGVWGDENQGNGVKLVGGIRHLFELLISYTFVVQIVIYDFITTPSISSFWPSLVFDPVFDTSLLSSSNSIKLEFSGVW